MARSFGVTLALAARPTAIALVLALVPVALPAAAQTGTPGSRLGTQASPPPVPAAEPTDPLHRDTPRGTIAGLNQAVHRDDFVSAARYMQITAAQRANAERLARDLTDLIDHYYIEPINALSGAPEGTTDDGLPLDRERVVLTIDGQPVDIELVRVKDPQAGLVWLISSRTLSRVPSLRRTGGVTWLGSIMPESLVNATLLGISFAQWVAWAATVVIPLAALWLLSTISFTIAWRTVASPTRRQLLQPWYAELRWPVILVVALGIHLGCLPLLGFSLRFRFIYSRLALVAIVMAAAWLLWRLMALSFAHARIVAQRKGQAGVRSLLLLAERVSKVVVVLVVIFALLTIAGVDTTTALAGVGLGGVAVALGAQKSVENLIGGVLLLTDRVLAVGDTCSIANRVGVIEDITMRSVRLRTVEQTLLSVPAGLLAQSNLENFASRDKILVQSTVRLRYQTTAGQLRLVLSGIRTLLDEHPEIETQSARIRLVDFGVRAIELELFAYVLTRDFLKFLAVREELLLQVATIVESSGTGFAQPTMIYEKPGADADVRSRAPEARYTNPNRGVATRGA